MADAQFFQLGLRLGHWCRPKRATLRGRRSCARRAESAALIEYIIKYIESPDRADGDRRERIPRDISATIWRAKRTPIMKSTPRAEHGTLAG